MNHELVWWTRWTGYAAAIWSALYGALGVYWTLGGAGFPFGAAHDPDPGMDKGLSILATVQQETAAPVIAIGGLAGAVAAYLMARKRAGGAVIGFGWLLAVTLTLVIQDYRPLAGLAHLIILPVVQLFGQARDVSVASQLPWPVLNLMICIVGGALFAGTAIAAQRHRNRACAVCGRDGRADGWTTPGRAIQWGTWAVWIAAAIPVLYAMTRWAWFLGIPIGFTNQQLHDMDVDTPGIWLAGASISTLAIGGVVLTFGLIQRWGEVFPRWIPYLRGRRVPIKLAVIPATVVAALITPSGLMMDRVIITDPQPGDWATRGPGALWTVWGVALAAAALAYYYRRRAACDSCHLG